VAYWLLKTEPGTYSWDDLTRDRRTVWEGVSNPVALKNIRAMKKGDLALIYHTGRERAVVGVAEVVTNPYADPNTKDERVVVVDVKPRHKLARPVTLDEFKVDKTFAGWDLLRIGRLSVVPVPPNVWQRIESLCAKPQPSKA